MCSIVATVEVCFTAAPIIRPYYSLCEMTRLLKKQKKQKLFKPGFFHKEILGEYLMCAKRGYVSGSSAPPPLLHHMLPHFVQAFVRKYYVKSCTNY